MSTRSPADAMNVRSLTSRTSDRGACPSALSTSDLNTPAEVASSSPTSAMETTCPETSELILNAISVLLSVMACVESIARVSASDQHHDGARTEDDRAIGQPRLLADLVDVVRGRYARIRKHMPAHAERRCPRHELQGLPVRVGGHVDIVVRHACVLSAQHPGEDPTRSIPVGRPGVRPVEADIGVAAADDVSMREGLPPPQDRMRVPKRDHFPGVPEQLGVLLEQRPVDP